MNENHAHPQSTMQPEGGASATLAIISDIVADIFEVAQSSLHHGTRLFEDLPCESIDLLEIGAGINRMCRVPVDDEAIFLRSLRVHILEAERTGCSPAEHLARIYPHLSASRIGDMLESVRNAPITPVLTIGDMVAYVEHARQMKRTGAA